jgi:hypothetical protein
VAVDLGVAAGRQLEEAAAAELAATGLEDELELPVAVGSSPCPSQATTTGGPLRQRR